MNRSLRRTLTALAAGVLGISGTAHAATYSYVDWTEANVAEGTASGTITLPDDSTVTVTFTATREDGEPGTLYGAQVEPGTNYWSPSEPYVSAEVENAPPDTDILQLSGGLNETYEVTLSEPIKDPVMAIVSLGQPSLQTTYDFDAPFTIVSQGAGYWGGSPTSLVALDGDVLEGSEGHGTIRFVGTFSTFSWTVPTPESWHGFTFAIRTTERIEPTPDPGAAGAGGADGSAGESGSGSGGAGDGGTPGEGGTSGSGAAPGAAGSEDTAGSGGEGGGGFDDSDDSGCGCSVPGSQRDAGSAAGLALALAAVALRRRHSSASRKPSAR